MRFFHGMVRLVNLAAFLLVFSALICGSQPASAQFTQQGPKLVGMGAVATSGLDYQGYGVALSADGNTAIVGGPLDNAGLGAVWFYTRSAGVWSQQGEKMVGTGSVVVSNFVKQGLAVALSADGNTAIVGGPFDNAEFGAVWIFVRVAGTWSQQGLKLVGTGAVAMSGFVDQGYSVALSADGNTALVGGFRDNGDNGAAWVFVRVNGGWAQQGDKLVGTGGTTGANQGWSVALSGDGNTAIVGGIRDNSELGAAWIYTRNNIGVWTQQRKLVGAGAAKSSGFVQQGSAVALSADGNTAIVGGSSDGGSSVGATWVFTRSGTTWTQQGAKLVGTNCIGDADCFQGEGVSLSADGNTAIIGGPGDHGNIGATWVFTRNGTTWSQRGNKLVGTGATGAAEQGYTVALSGDGNTAIVGGHFDNANFGAAWVFVPSPSVTAHDFNGDGKSDVVFRNTNTGGAAIWLMNGSTVTSNAGVTGATAGTPWQMVGTTSLIASTGDFNGDGKTDIVFRNTNTGGVAMWLMNGSNVTLNTGVSGAVAGLAWQIIGVGDFNGDGKADILWRNPSTGATAMWLMNGSNVTANAGVSGAVAGTAWQVAGIGDFNGDGKADILWRNPSTGGVAMWLMNGSNVTSNTGVTGAVAGTAWQIVGVGDFDGDGKADVLFRNGSTGGAAMWLMNGSNVTSNAGVTGATAGTAWQVVSTGDYNGDGKADVLFRNTSTGGMAMWLMNGSAVTANTGVSGAVAGLPWTVVE